MDIKSLLLFPSIVVIVGLVVEYWIIQPAKRKIEAQENNGEQKKEKSSLDSAFFNSFINYMPLKSQQSRLASGVLVVILSFAYYGGLESYFRLYNRETFYSPSSYFSPQEVYAYSNNNQVLKLKIYTPKYAFGSEEKLLYIQATNESNYAATEDTKLLVVPNYNQIYSRGIPPLIATINEYSFDLGSIQPNNTIYKRFAFNLAEGLLSGDKVKLSFYLNDSASIVKYSYGSQFLPEIYIDRFAGLMHWFFEKVLLSPWVNVFLLILVIIACTLGQIEKHAPLNSQIRTKEGLGFLFRILMRASGIFFFIFGLLHVLPSLYQENVLAIGLGVIILVISYISPTKLVLLLTKLRKPPKIDSKGSRKSSKK